MSYMHALRGAAAAEAVVQAHPSASAEVVEARGNRQASLGGILMLFCFPFSWPIVARVARFTQNVAVRLPVAPTVSSAFYRSVASTRWYYPPVALIPSHNTWRVELRRFCLRRRREPSHVRTPREKRMSHVRRICFECEAKF